MNDDAADLDDWLEGNLFQPIPHGANAEYELNGAVSVAKDKELLKSKDKSNRWFAWGREILIGE